MAAESSGEETLEAEGTGEDETKVGLTAASGCERVALTVPLEL